VWHPALRRAQERHHHDDADDPELVAKINAVTPGGKWPNIKTAALDKIGHPSVDLKVPFDMSPERYEKLGDDMVQLLGEDFTHVMRFFREELQGLKTSIAQELSEFCDGNPSMTGSENWRMVDYFPIRHEDEETAVGPRCGKHRDYGSFTIIVADQPGFEVYNTATGEWIDVYKKEGPGKAIVIGGYCLEILSGCRIPAALHRVVQGEEWQRRLSFCLFSAPTKNQLVFQGMTVQDLKAKMAPKWRHREGNIEKDEDYDPHFQDNVVRDIVAQNITAKAAAAAPVAVIE